MSKRVIALFLAVLAIFAVSACSDNNTASVNVKLPEALTVPDFSEPGGGTSEEKPQKNEDTASNEVNEKETAEKVKPAEKEQAVKRENVCSVEVVCNTALKSEKLSESLRAVLPQSGVILRETNVPIKDGESAFDILLRLTREKKVQLEFSKTPVYNSYYIEGIANLYELDCGELSGWMFSVNGEFKSVSSSKVKLKDGDRVAFVYTCDLGRDIGAGIGG